ncbi:serine racemase VanT catalytic subunit [Brevibacillus panacihumi]|uniref:Alanine racemase n=1 Tax=Brevibacillus panacihumi TaxID=497735 RepID=A0A3M8D288_9BACL|nr:serine racemase VanT catalytic subunit [Brevibacillus panacihumi]RNB82196.1 serine racemase VanT catalytic subunit [Brevibacillus panacihumi]
MNLEKQYGGIDSFRVIAALLVVAIHTSPLLSINETADFVFTRIIDRVGVPFFFMATGFFLLPPFLRKEGRPQSVIRLLAKCGKYYGIATLIYLPILFYKGYFQEEASFPAVVKDIFFDGTFYHLWYFPAVAMGACLLILLLQQFSSKMVFFLAFGLYGIGLFGDSYYGFVENVPWIKTGYEWLFAFSDYTRNGIFFAPVYLLLGGIIAEQKRPLSKKACVTGLLLTFSLLLAEGLWLHQLSVQRHDSMYIMLIPVMFFLFHWLLLWGGRSNAAWRSASMWIYIIHPLCIILVRGLAKVTNLSWLLVENSLVHYGMVVLASVIGSLLIVQLTARKKAKPFPKGRAWAEINLDNLRHNATVLQNILPSTCKFMAVVKANAYGHGDVQVAKELNRAGIFSFAVATLAEGVTLRQHGIKGDILILGYTHPKDIPSLKRYRLIQTVVDYSYAAMLEDIGEKIRVHVKVDTGMHRLGESYSHIDNLKAIFGCKHLLIEGIYTHLSAADSLRSSDVAYTRQQIGRFYDAINQISHSGYAIPRIHIQSSYGVLNYPELDCDYVRVGIALYGAYSHPLDQTKMSVDLRPVMAVKARVSAVKEIPAGDAVSYGRDYIASRPMKIAVVAIGYADGLPRNALGSQGQVLIYGHRAPIVGKICMDQMMIDITDIPGVAQGDTVTIWGQDGAEQITAEQIAANSNTITNELVSRIGSRLERVYIRHKQAK